MSNQTDRFAGLSAQEKRALLAELLRKKAAENTAEFPLSYGQKALVYLTRLDPDTPTYNTMFVIGVEAQLNIDLLRDAFREIIARHDTLRTSYGLQGKHFVQRVHAARDADFEAFDASTWDRNDLESRLVADAACPYDLECDSVIRLRAYSRSRLSHVLMLGVHHITFDYWSYDIFAHELIQLYACKQKGVPSGLAPLKYQFRDFVQWQRRTLASPRGEQLFQYWQRELAGELPVLNLPADRVRPMVQTYHGSSFRFRLESGLVCRLRTLANQRNVTLYTLLLAAFQILLHRYTGQEDILIGSPMACRDSPQFEHLIAYFSNVVPLRANLAGDPFFTAFLGQVRTKVLGALEHQDYPLPLIVERIAPKLDPSRSPLLDVAFSWEKSHHQAGREALNHDPETQLPLDLLYARQLGAPYDVILLIFEGQASLSGTFLYNSDLFDQERISRMAAHFEALLLGIADHPDGRISELSWFTDQERQQIVAWNSTASAFPSEQCLHQLFEVHASSSPDAVAAWCEGEQLSYAELNRRANQLARYLAKKGVGPDVLVGLCIGRSIDMLVALLGIMKAGGAYVPLDPDYPSERLAHMLADSGVQVLLTEATLVERLPANQADLVRIDTDREQIAQESAGDFHSDVRPDNLVYVIYTSGSTGKPKGVLIEHRGLSNLAEAQLRTFALRPDERVLQFASLSYDASIFEIAMAIKTGATLYIATGESRLSGEALVGLLRQEAITNVTLPPSIVALMPAHDLPALRTMVLAGEPCTAEVVARWAPGRRLFNAYGPTETTVWATVAECHADMRRPPIGRPILNTQVYPLDRNLQPVPIGVAGELHIGGVGLARGYLNRPELTAEKFIPDRFREDPSARLYKTGDLARYLPNGDIEFLGRIDHQVKVRGFRIELGEIEAQLKQHPGVAEAVVLARDENAGEKRLVAYVVPHQKSPATATELRNYLKSKLPPYMVPGAFVILTALPLTPNAKIDRRALPAPGECRPEVQEGYVEPKGELERSIAAIWQELLRVDKVGQHDNFFDLGGHSLLLTQVHSRLMQELGRKFSIVDLFTYPTVSSLAGYLTGKNHQRSNAAIVPVSGSGYEPIAVIGMSVRFPGAKNVEQFWQNMRDGVESIRFFSDEELVTAGVRESELADPALVRAGGVLDDPDLFDAGFFGFNPREAEITDPQQRLFLECAYEALELAGCNPERFGARTGVFAGAAMSTYYTHNVQTNPEALEAVGAFQAGMGNDKDFVPTRVSYKLNLRGPSVNVQTACSTSLVAVHFACRSLIERACDVALAGGVALHFPQRSGYRYQEGGIMSPDGHCRAFDARAQGCVPGNGAAAVVLKRLSQALADGDEIHAVIRGSAINNDGSLKVGYTAPSVEGQCAVILAAQAAARVKASSISYVETHGTGTLLGDPVEITALTQAFRASTDKKQFCAIGAVKSNIGHLDSAAGVAGLIKAVLVLKHKQLPPSLHYQQPNPAIDFASSPFYVTDRLREVRTADGQPRYAGVSSFGIGGTNAHVVLEEAPERGASEPSRVWQVLTLSAKTDAALEMATEQLADYLTTHPDTNIADVAYTLHVGRTSLDCRRAIGCSPDNAAEALRALNPQQTFTSHKGAADVRVAFMFPGGGAQYVNMGRGLYESEPIFREQIDLCAKLLQPRLGSDLRTLMYPPPGQSELAASQMRQTCAALPALMATELAAARLWMSWGIEPCAMIGHSLGEYAAACIAGVFELEDALALVAERGRLMQSLPTGGMLAVLQPEEEVRRLLDARFASRLSIAAINTPGICVVSGAAAEIDEFEQTLLATNGEYRRLHIDVAAHSQIVEPILGKFGSFLRKLRARPPRIPYVSNVSGTWITEAEATDPQYWVRHLRQTVRFDAGAGELLKHSTWTLLEVGPGQMLSSIMKQHPDKTPSQAVLQSIRHPNDERLDEEFLHATLGQLWATGVTVDWTQYHGHERRRCVSLPTYPFERKRYWLEPRESAAVIRSQARKNIQDWFYLPSWERSLSSVRPNLGALARKRWLIFLDEGEIGRTVTMRLRDAGHEVCAVSIADSFGEPNSGEYRINPATSADYFLLLKSLRGRGFTPDRLVHLLGVSPQGDRAVHADCDLGFYSLLYLAQALEQEMEGVPMDIAVVTTGMQEVMGDEPLCPEKAMVLGPCRVIRQEYPYLRCRSIDVSLPSSENVACRVADQIIAELQLDSTEPVVAYRMNYRWVQSFKPLRLGNGQPPRLREQGVYLITGGLGGIGLELAMYLAATVRARLVLTSRTELPPREQWNDWLVNHPEDDAVSRRVRKLQNLAQRSAEVLVIQADVADERQMSAAVDEIRRRFGALHGVIHAAMVPGGCLMQRMTRHIADAVFRPKVIGTQVLERVLKFDELDFLVLCSSQRAVLGGPGQAEYAAASAYLDAFATACAKRYAAPVVSILWDAWKEVGVSAQLGARLTDAEAHGNMLQYAIGTEEGMDAFARILAHPLPVVVVCTQDLQSRIEQFRNLTTIAVIEDFSRTSLLKTGHPRPQLKTAYVAPRNRAEEILAEIWQQLLGINQIGVDDNFFELGGDSVTSIRIVARANQAGLRLSPKQVFKHPTITALAAVVGTASVVRAEPCAVEGNLPLTPIQAWFFEQEFAQPNYWNLPRLLEVMRPLDRNVLSSALEKLVEHHDALRLRFTRTPSGWQQSNAGVNGSGGLECLDLSGVADTELGQAIERACREAQEQLNFEAGPLFKAVLFNCGANRRARLLLVAHHLVVDIVSWQVLLEDLQTACEQAGRGQKVKLPSKTTSFKQWAHRLEEYTRSGAFNAEIDYWTAVARNATAHLPLDYPADPATNNDASADTVSVRLDVDDTRTLFEKLPQLQNTRMNDLLVAALLSAFAEWTGEPSLLIHLEGLGRDLLLDDVDLSRTVGWFTPIYPVLLEAPPGAAERETRESVKEQLRRIPNHGIGYGALRYLSGDAEVRARLAAMTEPEICFVYLGQSAAQPESWFASAKQSPGPFHNPQGRRSHLLAIDAAVVDGCLCLHWVYSRNFHRTETIERLAGRFAAALKTVLSECVSQPLTQKIECLGEPFNQSDSELQKITGAIREATS